MRLHTCESFLDYFLVLAKYNNTWWNILIPKNYAHRYPLLNLT